MPSVSIIVRTLNEKESLQKLLAALRVQNFRDFEVVVVDNESTDGTAELAETSGCNLVTIKREAFSFPRSMNLGAINARGQFLIFTVGHALPFRKDWISSAVAHFVDPKVAGVFSPVIPNQGASLAELAFYYPNYIQAWIRGPYRVTRTGMGVFGGTNIALPARLWRVHEFDESFGLGGEDGQWADWAIQQGYELVCDHRFSVRHSHALGFSGLKKQLEYWDKLGKPTRFSRKELAFRDDLKF